MKFSYIRCHGSGNEFVMVDAIANDLQGVELAELSRFVCNRDGGIGADGLLLLCERKGEVGMRMFNPDGSEAEMCGNGIRCVARLADERGRGGKVFDMWSGANNYGISREADIYDGIPTYGVDLAVRLESEDFGFSQGGKFVAEIIPALHESLRWTAINVGNPHIVAEVEAVDFDLLESLGRRILDLKEEFPHGINVSLVALLGKNRIFVATYERGAGITASCGTAMTSSATAMALRGRCDYDTVIDVENRGGMVRCVAHNGEGLHTQLIGNATYTSYGEIEFEDGAFSAVKRGEYGDEVALYQKFLER